MPYGPPQSAYTSQVPADSTTAVNTVRGSDIVCAVAGRITGLRYYFLAGTVARTLYLWHASGASLGTATTPASPITGGWKTGVLSTPVDVTAGQTVRVSQAFDGAGTNLPFTVGLAAFTNGDLTVSAHYHDSVSSGRPTTPLGVSPFVDVVFEAGTAAPPPMAITATPDPVHARIRLQVINAADGPVTIRRADTNGAHTVRQYEDQVSAAGLLDLHDYEAALTGPITYTATDHLGNTATVTLDAGMGDDGEAPGGPWLSHPNLPALNTRVRIIEDLPTFNRRSTEHVIYGRAAPVYTTQPLQTRTGTLSLLCASWDEWRQIHGLYKSGNAVLLRNTCLTDADYYHVADLTPAPTVPSNWQGNWRVDIAYTAVDQPEGALVGTVEWSWDDTVAAHDTWADVLAAYDTWAELVMGPTP